MSDVERMILGRVASGPLPLTTSDAIAIAPLDRFRELKDAHLIDGAIVKGRQGEVIKVHITGITHHGRQRLASIDSAIAEAKPSAVAMRIGEKGLWAILGIGGTLLTQWLLKTLGLN